MYCKHFGLDAKPFSITPDPRFLFLSGSHREALAHLLYGIGEGGGFVQLTGEVGTGKTTLCRALLEQLPESVDVALILNPKLSSFELVAAICDELQVEYPHETESLKVLIDHLNDYLLRIHAAGRRTILIIDEAQNLSTRVLEQIRLLTNLETDKAKLLQIVLIGQPELQTLLARNELRQLAQRITARYHLGALSCDETHVYVKHRLKVSGGHADLMSDASIDELYRLSNGIPRLINVLADRALLGAYVEDKRRVDQHVVRRAAREVLPEFQLPSSRTRNPWFWAAGATAAALVVVLLWYGSQLMDVDPTPSVAAVDAATTSTTEDAEPSAPDITEQAAVEQQADLTVPVDERELLPAPDPAELDLMPVEVDLGERLNGAADDGAGLLAWSGMFKLWGINLFLEEQLRPCDQAVRQGMRCLIRSGNWTQLRSLDRPAVMQMRAPQGRKVSVLLVRLDAAEATLELGGERLQWPLAEVDRYWYGQYVLLWRPPVGTETLRIGDRGQDVTWLRELLNRLLPDTRADSALPDQFDAGLVQQVKRFQAQHSLDQDGVVGSLTLIHLNSADARSGGPRLATPGQG